MAQGSSAAMQALLEKMSRVITFNITSVVDGKRDCFQAASGAIEFYADAADATEALQVAQSANPEAHLELEAVPLGKAFAVTQGLMGVSTPIPTKLLFSKATVAAVGEHGIPEAMRDKMRGTGPFPLFSVEELRSPGAMPVFLSFDDLRASWLKSGRPIESLPAAEDAAIDLRVLAASVLQDQQEYFKKLLFLAPRSAVQLHKQLASAREGEEVRNNLVAAKAIVDAEVAAEIVPKVAHVDEAPPALTSEPTKA